MSTININILDNNKSPSKRIRKRPPRLQSRRKIIVPRIVITDLDPISRVVKFGGTEVFNYDPFKDTTDILIHLLKNQLDTRTSLAPIYFSHEQNSTLPNRGKSCLKKSLLQKSNLNRLEVPLFDYGNLDAYPPKVLDNLV